MSRYKPYPRYKESGVEWLEEVPEHWTLSKLKYILQSMISGGTPKTDKPSNWCESGTGTPWVSIADISRNYIISETKKDVTVEGIIEKGLKVLPKGTLLYSIFASLGKVAIANTELTTNQAILGLIPNKKMDNNFLYWLLVALEDYVHFSASSNTQDNLNSEKVANFPIVLPITEQTTIANFLYRETAKIDTLIAKQERLIVLLAEKRQTLISHAVTKGLDPNVKMKDSGVEWLGEVPEHWKLPKLALLTTRIGDGLHGTPNYIDNSDYSFINGNNFINGKIILKSSTKHISKEEYIKNFKPLDSSTLLLSINGTIGNLAFYDQEKIMLGKSAAYINCNHLVKREYLYYFIQSSHNKVYFDLELTGTTIYNLSLESIRRTPITLPPIDEQRKIIDYLNIKTQRIDTLTEKAKQAITLLKERRTALISAAVTGKIDVRGESI